MQWNPRDQLYDHLMMLKNKRDTLRRNGRATVLFLFFILNFCIVSLAFACVLICNFFFFENLFCKKKKRKYLRIVLIISDLLAWSRLWHRVLPPSTFEPGAEIISRAKKYIKSTFLCNMCLFTGIGQKNNKKQQKTDLLQMRCPHTPSRQLCPIPNLHLHLPSLFSCNSPDLLNNVNGNYINGSARVIYTTASHRPSIRHYNSISDYISEHFIKFYAVVVWVLEKSYHTIFSTQS